MKRLRIPALRSSVRPLAPQIRLFSQPSTSPSFLPSGSRSQHTDADATPAPSPKRDPPARKLAASARRHITASSNLASEAQTLLSEHSPSSGSTPTPPDPLAPPFDLPQPPHVLTHKTQRPPLVPEPTPLVPDVLTFLAVIGRDLKRFSSKIPTWEALFTLKPDELRQLGVEPARTRRYLLSWLEKFRLGMYGPGGDMRFVEHPADRGDATADAKGKDLGVLGRAVLRIVWDPVRNRRYVVNCPEGADPADVPEGQRLRPKGYKVQGTRVVTGPHATPLPGHAGAVVKVVEGMWEHRRGQKLDGGERRRKEFRFKKMIAERKEEKEKAMRAKL